MSELPRGMAERGMPGDGPRRRIVASEDDWLEDHEFRHLYGEGTAGASEPRRQRSLRGSGSRLYTATIASTAGNVMLQAFHASIARSGAEVRARLARRFQPDVLATADIRAGIYPAAPLVIALVPPAVVEMIGDVQRHEGESDVRGFRVDIQQCIRA